jgi:hypothetical protein
MSKVRKTKPIFGMEQRELSAYADAIQRSEKEPSKTFVMDFDDQIHNVGGGEPISAWVFKGYLYKVRGHFTDDECGLLILEEFDKERRHFESLKAKFDEPMGTETTYDRPRIPEKVRIEVWRRDGDKCARCGSRERLEYDHVVPISRGGSNTARNVELLCESCNRKKSANVA